MSLNVVRFNSFNKNEEIPMNVYENLAIDLNNELNIDRTTADRIVAWLTTEGVLDVPILNETYN